MATVLKRLFWLAVLSGAGFAGWSLWSSSRRDGAPDAAGPPPTGSTAGVHVIERPEPSEPAATTAAEPHSFVAVADWVEPVEGACPVTHPIKANDNSGIFHAPGGRFYDRTRAERCYATPDAAVADGYRAAKS